MLTDNIRLELENRVRIETSVRDFINAHYYEENGLSIVANKAASAIRREAKEAATHLARLEGLQRIVDRELDGRESDCLPEIRTLMDRFIRKHSCVGYATARKIAETEHNEGILALLSESVTSAFCKLQN